MRSQLTRPSLELKVPLAISALLVLMIGGLSWVAYREVQRSTVHAADERLRRASQQLAGLLQAGVPQRTQQVRSEAARPALGAFVRSPTARTRGAALEALEQLTSRDTLNVAAELWDAGGERVLAAGLPPPPARASSARVIGELVSRPGDATLGPFGTIAGNLVFAIVGAVADRGAVSGYLLIWRRVVGSPQAARQLAELIGADAALLIGDVTREVWTDLSLAVEGPPLDMTSQQSLVAYERPGRGAYLARGATVAGTPWVVVIEFPRDRVLAPARAFRYRLTVMALVLLAAAAVGSWLFSRRITSPLAELTRAADGVAAGEPNARVRLGRRDEIGRLATAFNVMAEKVEERERAEARFAAEGAQAAEALGASEARLKAIVNSALDAVITIDAEGRITGWNPQAERTFQWRADEALGRTLADTIIPSAHRDAHARGLKRFLETGEGPILNQRIEITALKRDGHEFPVELTVSPARVGDQWIFSAFVRDISARKQAERRLAAQHAVTRVLAEATSREEAMPQLLRAVCEGLGWDLGEIWLVDPQAGVLRAAGVWRVPSADVAAFEALTPRTTFAPGVGLAGRVWKANEPAWIPNVVEDSNFPRRAAAVESGLHAAFGFPIRIQHQVIGALAFYSREIREPDRDLLEMMASVGSQIGQYLERRRAEQRSERLAAIVEASGDAIISRTVDGTILTWNPGAERLFGYTADEAVGQPLTLVVPPEHAGGVSAINERLQRGEHVAQSETEYLRKDGGRVPVSLTLSPIRNERGTVVAASVVARDISARRELEEQLRQAQKMEAVGRLAGGVAHDFNNCLTAILGYLDLIAEDLPADSPSRQDLDEIRKAAIRAASLTRQLLAFSRQQVLQPVVLNLNDVLEDIEKMLRRLIGEDLELRTALSTNVGNIRVDPGQIEQVILNLAVNARDAMPTGGKLTLETANAELSEQYAELHRPVVPGRYVMLAVSDTGVGMDPETKAQIFEPFFTTKEKGKGTGLGLSTVYGIVKQSGGYIWVYSEPGHGATFKLYFPRVDAPVAAPRAPELERPLAGTETILLAEDDELLRPLARGVLEKLGYTVLAAQDAGEALELAREYQGAIHLLLADVVMPGESGRELARRLAEARPETRVLYVSGYTDDAVVHHGMLEPGLNYLQKPFTPAALAKKVREVLDST